MSMDYSTNFFSFFSSIFSSSKILILPHFSFLPTLLQCSLQFGLLSHINLLQCFECYSLMWSLWTMTVLPTPLCRCVWKERRGQYILQNWMSKIYLFAFIHSQCTWRNSPCLIFFFLSQKTDFVYIHTVPRSNEQLHHSKQPRAPNQQTTGHTITLAVWWYTDSDACMAQWPI